MVTKTKSVIVFTDLDGSLLDHDSYDYTPALSAVQRLKKNNIPLIPVTSKTLAEINHLGFFFEPFPKIGENGMVMDIPESFFLSPHNMAGQMAMGMTYKEIVHFIDALPEHLHKSINGFHDMSVEDVVGHTGLTAHSASLAKQRLGSEPFLWSGNEKGMKELESLAAKKMIKITRGGRFYHLMSEGGKDKAIAWVMQHVPPAEKLISIALGDGPNDADMLACATYGVRIPNPHGKNFVISNPRGTIIEAPDDGPKGWALAVDAILDELGFSR